MKHIDARLQRFLVIECWVATAIFIIGIINFISPALDGSPHLLELPEKALFDIAGWQFNYYRNYLVPQLFRYCFLFGVFIWLSYSIVPRIFRQQQVKASLLWVGVAFAGTLLVNMLSNMYLMQYLFGTMDRNAAYGRLWQLSFLLTLHMLLLFVAYNGVKYLCLFLLGYLQQWKQSSKYLTREVMIGVPLYLVLALLLAASGVEELLAMWLLVVPWTILMYRYAFSHLIPAALKRKHPFRSYLLRLLPIIIVASVVCAFVLFLLFNNDDGAIAAAMFNGFLQFLVVAPVVWVMFKRQMTGKEELYALKKELGQSSASLDFLRSQINPHFLFNALNTLYGTAIQENAERTGEGIQKLGDMMRFMLQENVQEKISLLRDLEYLDNYVSLQTLRTQSSPGIRIQVSVPPDVNPMLQIAPMLLIPFVENAFKHGISLREESHIKISLLVKGEELFFDVYNSRHERPQHDPEQFSNGIGLTNVRQRLQLLYPGKHDLVIRETTTDFFVHLSLNLGK